MDELTDRPAIGQQRETRFGAWAAKWLGLPSL